MSGIIDFLEELRLKMNAGITASAIASSHGQTYVGTREELFKDNDYPKVMITHELGTGKVVCFKDGQTEDTEVDIWFIAPPEFNDYNSLYNADKTGNLRSVENIINYLHYNRSTEAFNDYLMNNTAYNAIQYRYRSSINDNLYQARITVTAPIAKYTRGAL